MATIVQEDMNTVTQGTVFMNLKKKSLINTDIYIRIYRILEITVCNPSIPSHHVDNTHQ